MFYAVRIGWFRGVFTSKKVAQKAIEGYVNPRYQQFFSRKVAENYVYERKNDHCIVYTDGSFKYKNKRAGYGVFFGCRDKRNLAGGLSKSKNPNSQRAEAVAACVALLVTTGKLEIRTDSLHLIYRATINPYYSGTNTDIYKSLHQQCNQRRIIWTYVKAHNGDFGNDNADVLAKYGARKPKIASRKFGQVGACLPT